MTLVQKLVEVYKKVDHVEKRGENKSQGYKYVRASDLGHAIRNALAELGVYAEVNFQFQRNYLVERGTERDGSKKSPMQAVDVRADVTFHDTESTETIASSGLGSGTDTGDKAVFKAQTGALKYALRNAFLVPDSTDPEEDENVDRQTEDRPTSAPKKVQPPRAEIPQAAASDSTATGDELPTAEELKGFYARCTEIQAELAGAGLKASRGLPINRKFLVFLLHVTGAVEAGEISRAKWNAFFKIVDAFQTQEGGVQNLIDAINEKSTGGTANAAV